MAKPKVKKVHSIDEVPSTFLMCRGYGHTWDDVTDEPYYVGRKVVSYDRHRRCPRCTSTAVQTFSVPEENLVHSKTTNPKEYAIRGSGFVSMADARRELRRRGHARVKR